MPDPPVIELVQMPDEMVITVTDSCKWSDIASKMGQMYNDLMNYLKIQKVQPSGAPFSIYDKWEPANQFTVFEEGFPVAQPAIDKGRVKFRILPACKAVMGVHYGAYDKTTYLYNVIDEYTKEFRLESAGGPMEVYVVNHMTEPDTSKWKTEIYFPVK